MKIARRILLLVIGVGLMVSCSWVPPKQPTEWSLSIAMTKMKSMTAEQQAAYVGSLEPQQKSTFCEKFACAPGCGKTFCECFGGAPWCFSGEGPVEQP